MVTSHQPKKECELRSVALPAASAEADQEVIGELLKLLDMARKGELVGFTYTSHYRDKSYGSGMVGEFEPELALGITWRLMLRFAFLSGAINLPLTP